jgi:hypothetical protein
MHQIPDYTHIISGRPLLPPCASLPAFWVIAVMLQLLVQGPDCVVGRTMLVACVDSFQLSC